MKNYIPMVVGLTLDTKCERLKDSTRIVEIHCLKYLSLAPAHFGSLWRTIVKSSSVRTNDLISSDLALSPIQPTISMLLP
jgi:hypothetical protein